MKKIEFLLTVLLITFSTVGFAKHIDQQTAKQVGQTFLIGTKTLKSVDNLELVYTAEASISGNPQKAQDATYFYVFNAGTSGFVIVAGDDNVSPILGYSHEGVFAPDNMPPNLVEWLEGYKNEIRYVIENEILATEQIRREWDDYYNGRVRKVQKSDYVLPLLQTQWDQSPYYNTLCPGNSTTKTVTGCVATAMAQVMKYWDYPPTGTGFHSYNCSPFGTLSANFGATTYEWSAMPNKLTSSSSTTQRNAVATLMYHCGVSVNMQYDYASNGGSGAYTTGGSPSAEHAFKTYFGYKNTLSGKSKGNYTNINWMNLLKTELDNGRPILYAGSGSSGSGHAFICDGYDNNDYFHFNWGWSGQNDGYFPLSSLNPGSGGAGGGGYNFTYNQRAIIGIEPSEKIWGDTTNSDLKLYSNLSISTSIWFGTQISLDVRVANYATTTFKGTFGAAVFNSEGMFVDFLDTTAASLSSGYYDDYTFSYKGGPPFIPGDYAIAIFYKTTDKDWTIVGNGMSYGQTNYREFSIEYAAGIETFSKFTVKNNGGRLIQNQSATVNVSMLNASSSDFYGKFRVSLSNLDGSHAQVIQIRDLADFQTNYLPPNNYYVSGLDFTGNITVTPGTYLMELAYQRKGETTWYYAGSSRSDQTTSERFQNPIFVIVEIGPDPYEPNDKFSQAYKLPVNFSGNNASVKTTGSNFHLGTDQDYYKIDLSSGYNYTITARLHDSYNSGNGTVYSANGLFSYSTDGGTTWSDIYDDVMPNDIAIQDGGTAYFHVTPYLAGETGTYLLELSVKRTSNTGIETIEVADKIKIYPNPTNGQLTIENGELTIENVEMYNVMGQLLQSKIVNLQSKIEIDVSYLANGVYIVRMQTDKGTVTRKIRLVK